MASSKRVLFVYNPVAGNRKIPSNLSNIVDQIVRSGFSVEVYPSQYGGDGQRKVQEEGALYDRVIVAGGDGMLHEAVNGIMASCRPVRFGYVPAGTVNDFAGSHDIPSDVEAALAIALQDEERLIDVGRFNGAYFSYVAGFGVPAQASFQTSQDLKNRFGYLAYVVHGMRLIDYTHWENNCVYMEVETDNGSFSGDFVVGMVSNSRQVSGNEKLIYNDPEMDDGLLEVLFVRRPMNISDLNEIVDGIHNGNYDSPLFHTEQASWVKIHGDKTDWTLDGEYGGALEDVEISCVPRRLKILAQ